jgi:hypothetical protein
MTSKSARPTPALRVALELAGEPAWLADAAADSGGAPAGS